MTISVANLKVFAAVARAGSLKDAAESLGRTTSAVSMSLKQVEDEVGAKLFETERKNRLTAVGQFMLLQVADLLAHYDRTMATLHAYARTTIGRVDIVCVPSVSNMILPMVVSVFREQYPEVEIDVRDTDSENVVAAVAGGTADLGIGSLTRPRAGIYLEPLFEDGLCIICRDDDPLARQGPITDWKFLRDRVLLTNGICNMITDPDFREIADRAPIGVYNVLSLIALVRASVGITVLPRLSVIGLGQDISFVPIALPSARRRVGLLRRMGETGSPATAAFIDILRNVLKSHRAVFGIELAAP